ncbi:HPr family phosphocarrier protein [Bacillus sp. T17B1]|nr:HPr family phosphocarrier protein [Bacillus sp. T17B1]
MDEVSRSHLSFSLKNPTKSLIVVMSLSITGTHIQIRAEGIDEEQALQAIEDHMGKSGFMKSSSGEKEKRMKAKFIVALISIQLLLLTYRS